MLRLRSISRTRCRDPNFLGFFSGLVLPLLLAVAFLTLYERKAMGSIQRRSGPNVVGVAGLLQALADGLKLCVKEAILPSNAHVFIFLFAPIFTFLLGLVCWAVIPFGDGLVYDDYNLGLVYLLAVSSLAVYGIILSGWSSNSKYAFLGALRSTAQMISYEVPLGVVIVSVALCAGSFNLRGVVESQEDVWLFFPLFPVAFLFFISALAETNRHPFDLPEAEAELVSGYNVEYASMVFALFFLGEYANIIQMSTLSALMFGGGWLAFFDIAPKFSTFWLASKVCFFLFLFVFCRAALPRFRYDQLMELGWKSILPFSLAFFVSAATILLLTGAL